ncbi:hypothetical protein ACFV0T_26480 [Streptomyces sp. NPDC059582]|uniref:hypothetical protein n=1 Tax=Streptomyces sp. NPDC059582 TaxID=3346875 RepID=UPI0036B54024
MTTDKRPACPTPDKKRYATREAAEKAAHRSQIAITEPLHPYICICTWTHLSKQPSDQVPTDAIPDATDLARLQLQSDNAFRETVTKDARGQLPMTDRIALRHTSLLHRWKDVLEEIRAEVNRDLNSAPRDNSLASHDWRKRAEGYRDVLTLRLQECRDLRAQDLERTKPHHTVTTDADLDSPQDPQGRAAASNASRREARAAETDRFLDAHGVPQHTNKELRRQAGERAVQRLIDAHGTEFSHYLAEECAVLGATLPNRVRKYLTDQPTDLAHTA